MLTRSRFWVINLGDIHLLNSHLIFCSLHMISTATTTPLLWQKQQQQKKDNPFFLAGRVLSKPSSANGWRITGSPLLRLQQQLGVFFRHHRPAKTILLFARPLVSTPLPLVTPLQCQIQSQGFAVLHRSTLLLGWATHGSWSAN